MWVSTHVFCSLTTSRVLQWAWYHRGRLLCHCGECSPPLSLTIYTRAQKAYLFNEIAKLNVSVAIYRLIYHDNQQISSTNISPPTACTAPICKITVSTVRWSNAGLVLGQRRETLAQHQAGIGWLTLIFWHIDLGHHAQSEANNIQCTHELHYNSLYIVTKILRMW